MFLLYKLQLMEYLDVQQINPTTLNGTIAFLTQFNELNQDL